MMNCGTCGSEYVSSFYNKIISETWQGQRELVTYCEYCHTTITKKETGLA